MKEFLQNVRDRSPLIQNITNYVTINDCAQVTIACGASPIMADERDEAIDMATICDGLNVNIGTMNPRTVEAGVLSGKQANKLGHPVVLDPVGIGASELRKNAVKDMMEQCKVTVIRGNASEIRTIAGNARTSRGVDVNVDDAISEDKLDEAIAFVRELSIETGSIIAMSGAIDLIGDANTVYVVRNGIARMSDVSGTGCMLSSMTAAFLAANPEDALGATAAAFCMMGLAGEIAETRMSALDGNATYRNYLIDAIYNMMPEQLEAGAKYDIH